MPVQGQWNHFGKFVLQNLLAFMISLGIVGYSSTTRKHIEQISCSGNFKIAGITGLPEEEISMLAEEYDIPYFPEAFSLVHQCDLIDITSAAEHTWEISMEAVRNFRHVFIDCPIHWTPDQVRRLIKLAREAGVRIKVRHLKRHRKIFQAAKKFIRTPRMVDANFSELNQEGSFDRIYAKIFQCIDLLVLINPTNVKRTYPNAVVMSDGTLGAINVRMVFDDGMTANLLYSRTSGRENDSIHVYSEEGTLKIDFLNQLAGYLPYQAASRFTIPVTETIENDLPECITRVLHPGETPFLTPLEEIYSPLAITSELFERIYHHF